MTLYPIPSGIGDFLDVFQYSDTQSGSVLGIGIVFAVLLVTFLALLQYGARKSLTVSLILTSIVSIILRILDLLAESIFLIILVCAMAMAVFFFVKGEN